MSSPIDPVTGLPMVGVPDVVSQIPLGVQVVPWDDVLASDRPQGGPSYPNDIIDTFAWVTGENIAQPGTVHAGTMTNDRRLRVDATISGGSTGAGTQPTDWEQDTGTNITGSDTILDRLIPYPQKVFNVSMMLVSETLPTAYSSVSLLVYVSDNDNSVQSGILSLSMAYDPATGGGELSSAGTVYYGPNGLFFWGNTTEDRTAAFGYWVRNNWAANLTLSGSLSYG